jgi:hypothetical protein
MLALDTGAGLFWCAVLPFAPRRNDPPYLGKRRDRFARITSISPYFVVHDLPLPFPSLSCAQHISTSPRLPGRT